MSLSQLRESEALLSAWTDFTDSLVNIGTGAADAYGAIKGATPATTPAPAAATAKPAWVVPAMIVVGLLFVVAVVIGLKKR